MLKAKHTSKARCFVAQSPIVRIAALMTLATFNQRAHADCQQLPNGSFTKGFENWTVTPAFSQTGPGFVFHDFNIVDGTMHFEPLDENAMMLQAVANAAGPTDGSKDESIAIMELKLTASPATLTDRYLTFKRSGGFELLRAGLAVAGFDLTLDVRDAADPSGEPLVTEALNVFNPPPFKTCEFGFSVLGVFGNIPPIAVDLLEADGQPTGLTMGDSVIFELTLRCTASASNPCDEGEMAVTLLVDQFRLCANAPSIADVNGDNVVNILDLLAVISAWGVCPTVQTCAADIAPPGGDGDIDIQDLLAVIANWG